jgi:hypothetical protein
MSLLSRLAVQAARAYGVLSSSDKTKVSASYLSVAGGGGAGSNSSGYNGGTGGGGAGGLLNSTFTLSTLNTYNITVGAGGAAGASATVGSNGADSIISGTGLTTVTSVGGGGGGKSSATVSPGSSGGSGGGGGGSGTFTNTGGSATSGQGNAGGTATHAGANYGAAGGGGAGAVGGSITGINSGGNGGAGLASSISGSSVTYAGGGGGGGYSPGTAGTGGSGGGGNGSNITNGSAGTANLGGGGGGAGAAPAGALGGAGGSGIVIISYTSATPKFVGGTLTTSGGNQIHTFTSSGTLSPLTPVTASYLVVAGGGGGATNTSAGASGGVGGGGAGGLLTSSTTLYSGATYIVTVGAGGAGASSSGASGSQGSTSSLGGTGLTTISTTGGGFGAGTIGLNGGAGGSGGGGYGFPLNTYNGGAGTSGQGNAGARGYTDGSTYTTGGGGGGAGAAATQKTNNSGGDGGIGVTSSITGTSTYYAGGGGGGAGPSGSGGTGGLGGGGNGSVAGASAPSGTANTGGGGGGVGGGNASVFVGGSGGSGTVIISYAGSQVFNGGLVTSSGGNTIHTFNATGALTPLTNNLNNSLRFRSSASAFLNRTPSVAGNRKTWTWSAWVKRGTLGTGIMFSGGATSSDTGVNYIGFLSDQLIFAGISTYFRTTSQVFRDPSAWYHIVFALDTTQATAADRAKIYINGNQVTAFTVNNTLTLNADYGINQAALHRIGAESISGGFGSFDGYMDDINFIDGQALEPYYFGNNDANGVWKPIKYTGMYGTNGFYLTFADTTSTTTLGYDSSGNNNNWTTNNISLTAGTTYDAMLDVPTNTSATVANYAVLNPLRSYSSVTIASGNLNYSASFDGSSVATIGMDSGKYYWEATLTNANAAMIGLNKMTETLFGFVGYSAASYGYFGTNGNKFNNNVSTSYGNSYTNGDVIGVAFDATNGKLFFSKNGTWQNSGDPAAGTNAAFTGLTGDTYVPAVGHGTMAAAMNFGQRPFSYTPPTGFVRLNTFNLPTPTILQGNKYMDATLYTGTGTSQVIVNQALFKPDFVWGKRRNGIADNILIDSVVGGNPPERYLSSNTTSGTTANADVITALNSNGFTVGTSGALNGSSNTYVGWQWQAGQGSTSTNTSGSITSTVSVNATAGFSVVTYTGTGSNATVGHGLGVAPRFIIVKQRGTSGGGDGNWIVGSTAGIGWTGRLILNGTFANEVNSTHWNNTAPTSTVFSLGTSGNVNGNTGSYVAYCWAAIAGYSAFGSYTGNGNADGVFNYCGFQPKYIMIKCTNTAGTSWLVYDTARNTYNQMGSILLPDSSSAELTGYGLDVLSNGFKLRIGSNDPNFSGRTYIFAAFASNPFRNSNAF